MIQKYNVVLCNDIEKFVIELYFMIVILINEIMTN